MKEQSSRQFISSCFYWAISGFGFSFISFCAGCKEERKSTSQHGFIDIAGRFFQLSVVIWCHILILLNFSESRMQTYIDLA